MRNRTGFMILALTSLASGGVARASATHSFSAQSLIIPMDMCYQPSNFNNGWNPPAGYCPDPRPAGTDGVTKAYGVVYRLLEQGIKVYYIVDDNKAAIDAADMSITALAGTPAAMWNRAGNNTVEFMTSTHTTINYRGAPYVIDAVDAAAAEAYIKTQTVFDNVRIHVAKQNFQAPVKAILLQTPPKIALVDLQIGGNPLGAIGVLTGYLHDAGLDTPGSLSIYPDTTGTVFTRFQNVADFTSGGLLTGGFKIVWAPHWEGDASPQTQAMRDGVVQAISDFIDRGNPLFSECASIGSFEGSVGGGPINVGAASPGHFMTTGAARGLTTNTVAPRPWPTGSYPGGGWKIDSNSLNLPLVQMGDFRLGAESGFIDDFSPNTASGASYKSGVVRLITSIGGPSAPASWNDRDLLTIRYKDDNPTKGQIIYLGGHSYGSTGGGCSGSSCTFSPQTPTIAGERIILNSLMFLGQVPHDQELTRSSPIVFSSNLPSLTPLNDKTFIGTYVEQSQPRTAYPPWLGHFRQYPAGSLRNTRVSGFGSVVVDWDAADHITAQAARYTLGTLTARKVFTAIPQGGTLTQIAFSEANAGTLSSGLGFSGATAAADAQTAIHGILGGSLGGIDHSVPAIATPSTIAGSPSRPTVAYVGALDGMLHAILIAGSAGSAQAGDELWAFVPPSQLGKIANYAAGVDGSPQLGDASVTSGSGIKTWRTLLTVSNNNFGGTIDVLDVTDPLNPTFLWEGSHHTSGGEFVMGATQGAAFSTVVSSAGVPTSGIFVASTNQGTAGNGFNLYALDASDGSLLWTQPFSRTYQRFIPGTTTLVPNDVPGAPAVTDLAADGSPADRVIFGDIDGNIWAIDAHSGTTTTNPLYSAGVDGEPIETGVSLYIDATTHDLSLIAVTGGADWVPSSVLSNLVSIDVKNVTGSGTSNVINVQALSAGERVYAAPTFAGNDVYIVSSFGKVGGDIGGTATDPGILRRIDLATFQTTATTTVTKGTGEVAVTSDGSLVAASAAGVTQVTNTGRDNATNLALNTVSTSPVKTRAWLDLH